MGGCSTKLHAACDTLGNPLKCFITAGQRSDYVKALDLIQDKRMNVLIADRGYDANYIVDAVEAITCYLLFLHVLIGRYKDHMIKNYIKDVI